MNENIECPNCGKDTEFDDTEMYEQDEDYEIECNHCTKTFQATLSYLKCFSANKTDCLNDGNHTFRQVVGAPEIYFKGKYHCTQCGLNKTVQEEVATKEEIAELYHESN